MPCETTIARRTSRPQAFSPTKIASMTGRISDLALEHLVAQLERDVQATLGRSYEPLIRQTAQEHRMFFDEHAGEHESVLDQFFDRVVDDTQRYFHRFVDTSWPPCPEHPHHALWLVDDHWTCKQDQISYGRLGDLQGHAPVQEKKSHPVNSHSLKPALEEFAQVHDVDLAQAPHASVFALMLRFYAEVRVAGCDPADDEDMLLLDWGSYDWGEGRAFEIDLSREVTLPDNQIWQLHILYRFPNVAGLSHIPVGNDWWGSPDNIQELEEGVNSNVAVVAVADKRPVSVDIYFENAG